MGRYDADFGMLLSSNGNGLFNANGLPGITLKGEVRCIRSIKMQNENAWIIAFNNDSLRVVKIKK
jgi:enediyne biosynthesis protein E4